MGTDTAICPCSLHLLSLGTARYNQCFHLYEEQKKEEINSDHKLTMKTGDLRQSSIKVVITHNKSMTNSWSPDIFT